MSSIIRVHTTTWYYFSTHLPEDFRRSPKVVQEVIMTDIDELVEEFRRTPCDVGASFFAMRRLLDILQDILEVCFDNISNPNYLLILLQGCHDELGIKAKIMMLLYGYRKMFDQSICKSKELGDMLRFLPGVVVQKHMSVQGMAGLYRIKPDSLERLIKSTPLRSFSGPHDSYSPYKLQQYLSDFLQDRDRSQLYYCDPTLQHIFICRHILSLLARDESNAFDPHT